MTILICGGDERNVILARLLAQAGHEVLCYCLDCVPTPEGCTAVGAPDKCDAVILPVPAEAGRGLLNAPLGTAPCRIEHILDCAGEGAMVIGGKLGACLSAAAKERGQTVHDYMLIPEFTAKNAAITAEGAVSELMKRSNTALCDMRILVIGWGRIGKLLIKKLGALCANVCLLSRNPEARALASELGCRALPPDCPAALLGSFDAVINTAPAPVVPELCAFKDGCILFELASAPGGLDKSEADRRLTVLRALPGKYAPESAARAVFSAVSEIIKERDNYE